MNARFIEKFFDVAICKRNWRGMVYQKEVLEIFWSYIYLYIYIDLSGLASILVAVILEAAMYVALGFSL